MWTKKSQKKIANNKIWTRKVENVLTQAPSRGPRKFQTYFAQQWLKYCDRVVDTKRNFQENFIVQKYTQATIHQP